MNKYFILIYFALIFSCSNDSYISAEWKSISLKNYRNKGFNEYFAYIYFDLEVKNRTSDTIYFIDSYFGESEISYSVNGKKLFSNLEINPSYVVFNPLTNNSISLYTKTTNKLLDSIGISNLSKGKLIFNGYKGYESKLSYLDSIEAKKNNLIIFKIDTLKINKARQIKIHVDK